MRCLRRATKVLGDMHQQIYSIAFRGVPLPANKVLGGTSAAFMNHDIVYVLFVVRHSSFHAQWLSGVGH